MILNEEEKRLSEAIHAVADAMRQLADHLQKTGVAPSIVASGVCYFIASTLPREVVDLAYKYYEDSKEAEERQGFC